MSEDQTKTHCPRHGLMERQETQYGTRWSCMHPGCTVACWDHSTSTPADQKTRDARHALHRIFDPLWHDAAGRFKDGQRKNKRWVRHDRAYQWLADAMGIPKAKCHFGMFTLEQCAQARKIIEGVRVRA